MPRRAAHALPHTYRRVNLSQVAREIDRTPKQTRRLLDQLRVYGVYPRLRHKKQGREITYDAVVIDMVKALIEVPHRHVGDGPNWLDIYLGDKRDELSRRRSGGPGPTSP